jgi:hypothetical protein
VEGYTRSARNKPGVCSVLVCTIVDPNVCSLSHKLGHFVLMFDGEKLLDPHVPPPHFWACRVLIGTERKRTSSSASASRQPIPARTCLSFQGLSAWWRDPQVRISTVDFVAPHEAARLTRWARLGAELALKDQEALLSLGALRQYCVDNSASCRGARVPNLKSIMTLCKCLGYRQYLGIP